MSNLYQDAILDAKALRASAMANAKAALEEAFEPKIQEMIRLKLQEEEDTLEEVEEVEEAKEVEEAIEEKKDEVEEVKKWRIQLDVNTTQSKLKEIQKFIQENISDML